MSQSLPGHASFARNLLHFLFQCPPELFWEFQKGTQSHLKAGWTLLFPTCTPWFWHQGWHCLGCNYMWGTGTTSWPTSNKTPNYQGPGAVFLVAKMTCACWKTSSALKISIPRRHFSHFIAFSTHHWQGDLINCWRCCWKPTTFYRFHDTPAADSCAVSLAQFSFGKWDFCFGQCYEFLHALTGQTEWVPLGGPVPPLSLMLFCVCGDIKSFFTFLGWTQKLFLCLNVFFSKMNFAVNLIQIIFREQIPAQTWISSSLQWPRMHENWSCLFIFPHHKHPDYSHCSSQPQSAACIRFASGKML